MAKIQLQKQRFTVSGDKGVVMGIDIDQDVVCIRSKHGGKEFVFKNSNDKQTLDLWREVIKCMGMAVDFAAKQLSKKAVKYD